MEVLKSLWTDSVNKSDADREGTIAADHQGSAALTVALPWLHCQVMPGTLAKPLVLPSWCRDIREHLQQTRKNRVVRITPLANA
jgi:hypothetical protein